MKSSTCWYCSVGGSSLSWGLCLNWKVGEAKEGERRRGMCWRRAWRSLVFCSASQTQKLSHLSLPHTHKHFDSVRKRKDPSRVGVVKCNPINLQNRVKDNVSLTRLIWSLLCNPGMVLYDIKKVAQTKNIYSLKNPEHKHSYWTHRRRRG